MSYWNEAVVLALRLHEEYGSGAVDEAQRRMDEARTRSASEWRLWMTVRDSLIKFNEPRP